MQSKDNRFDVEKINVTWQAKAHLPETALGYVEKRVALRR